MMARHPFFDQPSQWHTDVTAACADAANTQRTVFVVVGPERCAATRAFVEKTLCKDEVVEMLDDDFVPVCVVSLDDPQLAPWAPTLPKREPTPVCLYLTADAKLVLSTVGGRPPAVVMNDFMQATRARRSAT